ncbi:mismatched base pair and cruciform DNA recognition protein [Lentinula guzmanii]|uniref:Mismatched base pair and cruciform DNA recognition protein n=1 Tax=Lentinula guzmanii TaxID=2804957 RepID=A0AA38MSF7_9AGAR|nr:mismatched base pair and cruciform DNA recognition protein [Lentinula guzmanii]
MSSDQTTSSEPSKANGQYNSMMGTTKEFIGNVTGADSWTQDGKDQHAKGEAEYNAAQATEYAKGTYDRAGGKIDSVVGAVTGDKQQQMSGNMRHDKGQVQQEANKPQ